MFWFSFSWNAIPLPKLKAFSFPFFFVQAADYMWFRNYMPTRAKLSDPSRLVPDRGSTALACQCSWCNVAAFGGKHPHTHWFVG